MTREEAALAAERGYALVDMNRPQEAIALLQRALAADPDDVRLWCGLSRAHLRAGEFPAALGAADRALAAGPGPVDPGWPHRLRSSALRRLGHVREALDAARAALRLDPDAWQNHVSVVDVLLVQPELALSASLRAEQTQPAGDLRDQLRRVRAGTAVLEAALRAAQLAPAEPEVLVCLAWAHVNRGEGAEALAAADRALAVDPHHEQALVVRAHVLRGRRRYAEAAKSFLRAASLRPSGGAGEQFVQVLRAAFGLGILAAFVAWFAVGVLVDDGSGLHGASGLVPVAASTAALFAAPGVVLARMAPDVRRVAVRTLRGDLVVRVRLVAVLAFLAVAGASMFVAEGAADAPLGFALLACIALAVLAGPVARRLGGAGRSRIRA